jgi:hypothetical protein
MKFNFISLVALICALASTSFAKEDAKSYFDYWMKNKYAKDTCEQEAADRYFSANVMGLLFKGTLGFGGGVPSGLAKVCSRSVQTSTFSKDCFKALDKAFSKIGKSEFDTAVSGCLYSASTYCTYVNDFNAQIVSAGDDAAATRCQRRIKCSKDVKIGDQDMPAGTADLVCRGRRGSCDGLGFAECPLARIQNSRAGEASDEVYGGGSVDGQR